MHIKYYVVATLLAVSVNFSFGQEFSRSKEFSSMRMNYDDIIDLVISIQNYTKEINSDTLGTNSASIIFGNDGDEISYLGKINLQDIIRNDDSDSFTYSYRAASGEPIESINITFRKYFRNVSISGKNQSHVSGLLRVIEEEVKKNETVINYENLDTFLFAILMFLGFFLYVILRYMSDKSFISPHMSTFFIILGFIVFIYIVFQLHSFTTYFFPNFYIYSGEKSFMSRNADLFEFIGFIALIGGFLWSILKYVNRNIVKNEQEDS